MLNDIITKINDAYRGIPTPCERIFDLLKQLLEVSGYSPYVSGESKKITKLIKRTNIDIVKIEHRWDYEFGSAMMTYVTFSSWSEDKEWGVVCFEYCWG
ncbi:hypothetical protein IKG64_02180 [Candidatus Saccharibacteria bacterium]|nr:hypothetical protein [Candidatus Saccharibacteria bacterium]